MPSSDARGGVASPQKSEPKPAPFDPKKNYCGSQGFDVPDGNWAHACKLHDDCYENSASKEACDGKLAVDMYLDCIKALHQHMACLVPGVVYSTGLMLFGIPNKWFQPSRDAYNDARRKGR